MAAIRPGPWPSEPTFAARRSWYAAMPIMKAPPVRKAAVRVWKTTTRVVFWKRTAAMSVSSARPVLSFTA